MPSELKAALPRLQRSPVRKWANHGELAPCSEALPEGEEGELGIEGHGELGEGSKVGLSAHHHDTGSHVIPMPSVTDSYDLMPL